MLVASKKRDQRTMAQPFTQCNYGQQALPYKLGVTVMTLYGDIEFILGLFELFFEVCLIVHFKIVHSWLVFLKTAI